MSSSKLLPSLFARVSARFRTPANSIVTFCGLACTVLVFAALPSVLPGAHAFYEHFFRGEEGIDILADLYAFGAATSYSFVFIALIALRLNDPLSPRKFRIPINIPLTYRGEHVQFPVVAVIGFIGIFSILVFTMITHAIGRIAGPGWLIFGIAAYLWYRRRKKLPMFGSQRYDWMSQQITILRDAGELELMDELIGNIRRRSGEAPASGAATPKVRVP